MSMDTTTFRNELATNYQDALVSVEFEVDGFVKIAQGELNNIGLDYIRIAPTTTGGQGTFVQIYGLSSAGTTLVGTVSTTSIKLSSVKDINKGRLIT